MPPTATRHAGLRVPSVTFKTRNNDDWQDISTEELFDDRTVVVFSLPGAFSPTCSSAHLPRYNELARVFKANGVDEIVCIAVNDAFVMAAWKQALRADQITLMPDGNGEFTLGMGMLVDSTQVGFGMRSCRYAMVVRNGVIEKMFIEPEDSKDTVRVADADSVLRYLNPNAVVPEPVLIFSKPGCPHCARAKALLEAQGQQYEEISFGQHFTSSALRAVSGSSTWPQVFIGGKLIGNADRLGAYFDAQLQA